MTASRDVQALSIRIPREMHEELRLHRAFTGVTANDLVVRLLTEYLAGPGREAISRGMTHRATATYGEALRKLAQ